LPIPFPRTPMPWQGFEVSGLKPARKTNAPVTASRSQKRYPEEEEPLDGSCSLTLGERALSKGKGGPGPHQSGGPAKCTAGGGISGVAALLSFGVTTRHGHGIRAIFSKIFGRGHVENQASGLNVDKSTNATRRLPPGRVAAELASHHVCMQACSHVASNIVSPGKVRVPPARPRGGASFLPSPNTEFPSFTPPLGTLGSTPGLFEKAEVKTGL